VVLHPGLAIHPVVEHGGPVSRYDGLPDQPDRACCQVRTTVNIGCAKNRISQGERLFDFEADEILKALLQS
jgi:hypothetical protein